MANLYLADVSSNTKRSTETIYEIKAPLATFDTIDLDDLEEDTIKDSPTKDELNDNKTTISDKPEKGIEELKEQKSDKGSENLKSEKNNDDKNRNNKLEISDNKCAEEFKNSIDASVDKEPETPTPTKESAQFDNDSLSTLNSEPENGVSKPDSTQSDLMDPNSSENNASAEEIQTKLKQKGRKHKEKASNVKYEKIDSLSDISDHEKSENQSPLPAVKRRSKAYDSDSDSTDSDSGYIRTGFATARGTAARHIRAGISNSAHGLDFVDSDSTPCSSPKVRQPVVPPPLSKEDAEKRSKKKAYEKRLQRLQVTNSPIERPRSTTPINIVALEEYVNISSPEKSPAKGNFEKLKIKLPLDETGRRRVVKSATGEQGDNQVFSFNEELLFTHTKSAIILEEDGYKNQSPKRILVPPTLSPKLSPARSPRNPGRFFQDPNNLPKYIFSSKSPNLNRNQEDESLKFSANDTVPEQANWAKFDEVPNESDAIDRKDSNLYIAQRVSDIEKQCKESVSKTSVEISGDKSNVSNKGDESVRDDEFDKEAENEEILTVKIDKTGEITKCDIECHAVESLKIEEDIDKDKANEINDLEITNESSPDNERKGTYIISDDGK